MYQNNRRQFDRLALRLDVLCQKVGQGEPVEGRTLNISTGGVLLEMPTDGFCDDDLIEFDFVVPPIEGISNVIGKLRATGRIVRITPHRHVTQNAVAAQFVGKPRFCV